MTVASKMVGSEVRSERVLAWYGILPVDVQRAVSQPRALDADVDAKVEAMADDIIAAWKHHRHSLCTVMLSHYDVLEQIGRAGRVRLLSILTGKGVEGGFNIFAFLERERRLAEEASEGEASEESGPSPSAKLFALFQGDLTSLQRVISSRLVRGTSAKRTVTAIFGGIDDFEKTFTRSQGAFT